MQWYGTVRSGRLMSTKEYTLDWPSWNLIARLILQKSPTTIWIIEMSHWHFFIIKRFPAKIESIFLHMSSLTRIVVQRFNSNYGWNTWIPFFQNATPYLPLEEENHFSNYEPFFIFLRFFIAKRCTLYSIQKKGSVYEEYKIQEYIRFTKKNDNNNYLWKQNRLILQ